MSLIELLVVVIIIAVLAAIAIPTYQTYVVRTRRVAAEGCMMQIANYMERYYTTNMGYVDPTSKVAPTLTLDCQGTSQTGNDYKYAFTVATSIAYTLQATPINTQLARDKTCGNLTLDQTGVRSAALSTTGCW